MAAEFHIFVMNGGAFSIIITLASWASQLSSQIVNVDGDMKDFKLFIILCLTSSYVKLTSFSSIKIFMI